jgi:hypothetical protein
MESDEALEWLANQVEAPVLAAIQKAFERYLERTPGDDTSVTSEAEAAAALLVDLAGDETRMKYTRFSSSYLGHSAKEMGLWSQAIKVLEKMMEDKESLGLWGDSSHKLQVLQRLASDLQRNKSKAE